MSSPTIALNVTSLAAPEAGRDPLAPLRPLVGPIVAAVGGSESSRVLRAARYLGSVAANNVVAVSVIEPLPSYFDAESPAMLPPEFDEERREVRRASLAREVLDAAGPDSGWQATVLTGEPAHAIADLARTERSPLLVMGVGRHRPWDRLLGRETTLRTIHRASCPVFVVSTTFEPPLRSVIIATDFSPASAKAAEMVMPLLTDGAVVHLVHVWQPIALDDTRWRAIDDRYLQALPEKFRRFRRILNAPASVTITDDVREGRVAERLLEIASNAHADVIVAGRQGLNRLARMVVGSVTTSLLRGASCSLLIAPEPSFPDTDRLHHLLTGTIEAREPEAWAVQLEEFTRRNQGRRTTVEVDDTALGAQVLESGYALQGAAYDPNDREVEIMLADSVRRTRHVTRSIGDVSSVAIVTGEDGRDIALRISHAPGQTVLTFPPE